MSALPTGTVTFLFTDIESSTRLTELYLEPMREARYRHNALMRDAITSNNGVVFSTGGDSFCAAFAAATDALNAAIAAQTALLPAEVVPDVPLRVRMALHTGEARPYENDYADPALNRVARLLDTAHGGQIILSQATQQITRDMLPPETALRDLGEHQLKDLQRQEQIFQLFHPNLLSEFPPLNSLTRQPNNLPQQTSSFVGRTEELAAVTRLMAGTRLLTLTGTGGAGKTRLALQVAAESVDFYSDGVWLVELAAVTDPALVLQSVAATLRLPEEPGRPLMDTVTAFLHTKVLLLILDNCEHHVAACARMAEAMLRACPSLKILVTSRESLDIPGEQLFSVPTLALPDLRRLPPLEKLLDYGAIRLFVDRATFALPSFALTAQNAAVVARLCHLLDGIPLCLELAAARVRTFSVDQIVTDGFRLLSGGSRTAQRRQQTIEACIEWSDRLLTDAERLLFRRLSVFTGGWKLEAAEAVCSDASLESDFIFDLLPSLVQKSLVLAEVSGGETRYRFHETLRQYAWKCLLTMPDTELLRDGHRDYYLALAERAEPELRGPEQVDWLNRLEREHDNLSAAIRWSVEPEKRLRLASALARFWYTRGYLSEGRGWLEGALKTNLPVEGSIRAKALNAAGLLARSQSDFKASQAYHEQALMLYEQLANEEGIARTCISLGIVLDYQKEYDLAQSHYQNGVQRYRNLGTALSIANALNNFAAHFNHRHNWDAAEPLLKESLALLQTSDDQLLLATVYYNFGRIACERQDWQAAYDWLVKGLAIRKQLRDPLGIASCFLLLAKVERAFGASERAVTLLGAADAMHNKSGSQEDEAEERRALTQILLQDIGIEAYNLAWRYGQAMEPVEAADYVLQDPKVKDQKKP